MTRINAEWPLILQKQHFQAFSGNFVAIIGSLTGLSKYSNTGTREMTPNRLKFAQLHGLSALVMLAALTSGCAGSSSPGSDANRPTPASQLNDTQRFSVSMEWDIPLARVNGDPLYANDLTGYEIQYSTEQEQRVHSIRVNDPLQTRLQLRELRAGDYQFTIAALEAGGRYGRFSPGVSLTLQ